MGRGMGWGEVGLKIRGDFNRSCWVQKEIILLNHYSQIEVIKEVHNKHKGTWKTIRK